MSKIVYIGLGALINNLKNKPSVREPIEYIESPPLTVATAGRDLQECDAFLIGPFTVEPIPQAQRVNQRDPFLSIIILVFQEQFLKVKQALQFAYNAGKNVICLPYETGKDITEVLDNAVLKTRQRKSFQRITGQVIYPAATNREVTFRNLDVFLENAHIGAIVLDKDKNIISANQLARKLFSLLLEKKEKINIIALFSDSDAAAEVEQIIEGEDNTPRIIKAKNRFWEIKISPVTLENNKPHYLLLVNDVSDKVAVEHALKSKIEELEFLNKELDEFVNIISHDFKTPLTSVSLLAELAAKEANPEKMHYFIQQIKRSADKLKDMLNGLTSLVDIKKTKSEKVEQVNFSERLSLIIGESQYSLDSINAKVESDFSKAPDMYYFKAHIDSYLSNLITNAIKYRDTGRQLTIMVNSHREKEYVVLSVKDNGTGIDLSKNLNKLFQPFKRLTDQSTGSGLGLSIVKRMIESNHGHLDVFSQPGVGTEFIAYLKEQA